MNCLSLGCILDPQTLNLNEIWECGMKIQNIFVPAVALRPIPPGWGETDATINPGRYISESEAKQVSVEKCFLPLPASIRICGKKQCPGS